MSDEADSVEVECPYCNATSDELCGWVIEGKTCALNEETKEILNNVQHT